MKSGISRSLVLPLAAVLTPALVAVLLLATRDREPLRRAQLPDTPSWLVQQHGSVVPRRYTDRQGRAWWRYDPSPVSAIRIVPPPSEFPDGCAVAWFVRRGTPLLLLPASGAEPIPLPTRGHVRSGKIFVHRLSPDSLAQGATLALGNPLRLESLFVSFSPTCIGATEAGYIPRRRFWRGLRNRSVFATLTAAFVLLIAALAARYRATGSATAGMAAVTTAFALGALWFDSPTWSHELRIDKGDDSFYLAYTQNLANHGSFFRAPTDIAFGAHHLDHCHGLPGISLMLSPPLLARALPGGAARRGEPIDPRELRAMRTTSMAYALLATLLLFGALRSRHGGSAPPSAWDALLPALLLWGTSLPRWAFVRSIFTHPAELFLLCLALFLAARPHPRHAALRDIALAATVGLLFLVRGEYLLVAPLFLLLPRRAPAAPCGAPLRQHVGALLRRHGAPLLVLAAFAGVYACWISKIGTGYGRPSDAGLPLADGPVAVLRLILRNVETLLRSFIQNGAILPAAALLAIAAPFVPALRHRAADLPTSPWATALLAALLFLLNACFTPPLGDEFGHRYALKLYPFALLWLGTLLAGPAPATRGGRAARAALALLPVCALFANLRLLLRTGGTDLGQNFTLLSDLQFAVLPPCGSGALNLRFALWLLLAAWAAWLLAEGIRRHRHRNTAP